MVVPHHKYQQKVQILTLKGVTLLPYSAKQHKLGLNYISSTSDPDIAFTLVPKSLRFSWDSHNRST